MKLKERDFKELVWPAFADSMVLNLSIFIFMFIIVSVIMIFLVKDITENKKKFNEEKTRLEAEVKELRKFKGNISTFNSEVASGLKGFVTISGNKITIQAEILFKPNEYVIPPDKEIEIKRIYQSIRLPFINLRKQYPQAKLMIGGHSDDQRYVNENSYDNWSLSSDRARNVVKKFLAYGGFPQNAIFASGYADTVPPYQKPRFDSEKDPALISWRTASRRITIEIHQEQ